MIIQFFFEIPIHQTSLVLALDVVLKAWGVPCLHYQITNMFPFVNHSLHVVVWAHTMYSRCFVFWGLYESNNFLVLMVKLSFLPRFGNFWLFGGFFPFDFDYFCMGCLALRFYTYNFSHNHSKRLFEFIFLTHNNHMLNLFCMIIIVLTLALKECQRLVLQNTIPTKLQMKTRPKITRI